MQDPTTAITTVIVDDYLTEPTCSKMASSTTVRELIQRINEDYWSDQINAFWNAISKEKEILVEWRCFNLLVCWWLTIKDLGSINERQGLWFFRYGSWADESLKNQENK